MLGSALLWIGLPVAVFWLVAQVTDRATRGVLMALVLLPLAMVAGGWVLYRVNARYEALRGQGPKPLPPSWRDSLGEQRRGPGGGRRPPRLIDVAMTTWALVALLLFLIWYFSSPDLLPPPLG